MFEGIETSICSKIWPCKMCRVIRTMFISWHTKTFFKWAYWMHVWVIRRNKHFAKLSICERKSIYTSENSDDKIFETTSSMSVVLSSPFIMAFWSCCMSAWVDGILEVEGSMKWVKKQVNWVAKNIAWAVAHEEINHQHSIWNAYTQKECNKKSNGKQDSYAENLYQYVQRLQLFQGEISEFHVERFHQCHGQH